MLSFTGLQAYVEDMNDKKRPSETGIRVHLPEGERNAFAIDVLVDNLLHGDMQGVLHTLHEPHGESDLHKDPPIVKAPKPAV